MRWVSACFLLLFATLATAALQVNPTTLNFGNVDRNSGASKTFTLTNTAASAISVTVARTGNFVVASSPFNLNASEVKTITVNVEAGVPPGQLSGSITYTAGADTATIALQAAVVDFFKTSIAPSTLDFGIVTQGQSKTLTLAITNQSPNRLTYTGVASPSLYSCTDSKIIPSGATKNLQVAFNAGSSPGSFPGVLTVRAAKDSGQQQEVAQINMTAGVQLSGSIIVNPTALDFGTVDPAGAQRSIVVKNGFSTDLQFSVTHTGNFVVAFLAQSIAPNAEKSIIVNIQRDTPPGNLTGNVAVSAGGQTINVPLTANVVAGAFDTTLNPASLNFGTVNLGQNKTLTITVTNNTTGSLNYTLAVAPDPFSVTPITLTVAGGQQGSVSVKFTPSISANVGGEVTFKASNGSAVQKVGSVDVTGSAPAPKADLTIVTATLGTVAQTKPATASVSVNVKNIGEVAAVACKGTFANGTSTGILDVPALNPGQSTVVTITVPVVKGANTILIGVDSGNAISEVSERNNEFTLNANIP